MKRRSTPRQVQQTRKAWFRFFRMLTLFGLLVTALLVGIAGGMFASVSKSLPDADELSNIRPPAPTRILAADGTLLGKVYSENREVVPIERMKNMVPATIAIEDVRFYDHIGVDPRGIARAVVKNVLSGNSREGASTITQQLARNIFLSREKTISRKLKEMVIAIELERRYSKMEILEAYLNQVYYGANRHGVQSWGVQMAARNFFNKDVSDLTIAEASLLAGLPKNPRDYNPYRYPKSALDRRNMVLSIMRDQGLISRAEYRDARETPIKLVAETKIKEMADFHAPYFVRHILTDELKRILGQDWMRMAYQYGIDIHTSLDPRMQKVAEEAVTASVERNRYRRIDDGALIAIDPKSGYIKAMVGGTNYRKDQFNIVTQGHRQPGSAFKPFDYTTALLHGYTPDTIVHDEARAYPTGPGQKPWTPKNSDGGYRGAMPLKRALWLSRNAAAAGVAYDVGIDKIIDVAHRMGIVYKLEEVLSSSLGASVVVPMEICSAYGTLANGGIHYKPHGIVSITTYDGQVLYEDHPRPRRAIPTDVADTMQDIMRGVIERGTARAARCPFRVSGKTGTTNSFRDAWFIGYSDDLVAAVWVGNRSNKPMNHTFGGTVPAPIWREFMLVAHPIMAAEHKAIAEELARRNVLPEPTDIDRTPTPYILKTMGRRYRDRTPERTTEDVSVTVPPGEQYTVRVCTASGDRATRWCPESMAVTYIRGRAPSPPAASCSIHTGPAAIPDQDETPAPGGHAEEGVLLSVCAETGKLATDRCPTVLQKRFTRNMPTETCPLHGGY